MSEWMNDWITNVKGMDVFLDLMRSFNCSAVEHRGIFYLEKNFLCNLGLFLFC